MNGFIPTADKLFEAMGINEPLPKVDYVRRPRDIDLTQFTEQEREWIARAQREDQR
jgi:hypothetical protein